MKNISVFTKNIKSSLVITFLFIVSITFFSCGKKSSSVGGNNANNNNSDPTYYNVNYSGTFMKSNVADSTSGNGTVAVVFNTSTLQLSYTITWHGLSSMPVAMHFHDNGPVIITITGYPVATDQSMSGMAKLTPSQVSDLTTGLLYVMIHTKNYPDGEIMAPIVKQ
jgi:hypothetical protein